MHNGVGENSDPVRYFLELQKLSKERHCTAGTYYREEVLVDPKGTNHQNIRNFIKSGWDGIAFTVRY
jgi:hypothetical protein